MILYITCQSFFIHRIFAMTITYTSELHTAHWFNFFRVLLKWKGSVYKLIYRQSLVFFTVYFGLLFLYTFALSEESKHQFEKVVEVFAMRKGSLGSAVAFFLGFFIDQIFRRFWRTFLTIPWPDAFAFLCSSYIVGYDNRSRLIRRTLVRYICASVIMSLSGLSPRIKRRFPEMNDYVASDLLTSNEAHLIESEYFLFIWYE